MGARRLLGALTGALFVACASTPAALEVERVEPASGGQAGAAVAIVGRNFFFDASPAFNAEAQPAAGTFRAELGSAPLLGVSWVDSGTLSAIVPAGLQPGVYALTVRAPDGRSATLARAFQVEAGPGASEAGGGDLPADEASTTEPPSDPPVVSSIASVAVVSAVPAQLLADGVDASDLTVRVADENGAGLPGLTVTMTVAGGGSVSPSQDLGGGLYGARYVSALSAVPATATVTASVQAVSGNVEASITLSLRPACDSGDDFVATWAELSAALAAANGAANHRTICVASDVTIAPPTPIVLSGPSGVTLRGAARSRLSGAALASGEPTVEMRSEGNVVESVVFEDAAADAVLVTGSTNVLTHNLFDGCFVAVTVTGSGNTVGPGNEFVSSLDAGVRVSGDDNAVVGNVLRGQADGSAVSVGSLAPVAGVVVAFNRFLDVAAGLDAQNAENVRVDNNTFARVAGTAVDLDDSSQGALLRNNVFSATGDAAIDARDDSLAAAPAHNVFFLTTAACTQCTLGESNQFADPLLTSSPDELALSVSPRSPCIDAGLDVGAPYLGAAPDVGALEAQ